VYRTVPADRVEKQARSASAGGPALEPFRMGAQLLLALLVYFMLSSLNLLIRSAMPVALKEQLAPGELETLVGLAFTLGGVGSALGVLVISGRVFRAGRLRGSLALGVLAIAACFLALALLGTPPVYLVSFCLFSLLIGAMTPPNNTLIALNIPRARRGTAFGFAGSAQALSFMAGPLAAATFPAISFGTGYSLVAAATLALAALVALGLREPKEEGPA
jgi:MFS family permease